MIIKKVFFLLLINTQLVAQQINQGDIVVVVNDTINKENIDNIYQEKSPLKASLLSAFVPGMGQLYNKKWWKAPIAAGLVGTGIGFSSYYNGLKNRFRRAYLSELSGQTHEYSGILNAEQLAVYQDEYKRYRDYSIALTILAYLLNVVDATVDAHLSGAKKELNMSFSPTVLEHQITYQPILGLNLNFKF